MWLWIARDPLPDAPYWAGRRWLAAIDAAVWRLQASSGRLSRWQPLSACPVAYIVRCGLTIGTTSQLGDGEGLRLFYFCSGSYCSLS